MAVDFNHTILSARHSRASAEFLTRMLGLPAPRHWGPFYMVATNNGANLDYMDSKGEIARQHYAILVGETEFDAILGLIRQRKLPYLADPGQEKLGQSNNHDRVRGLYFEDTIRH